VNEIAARARHFQRAVERIGLALLALLRRLVLKDHDKVHGEFLLGDAVCLQFCRGLGGPDT